MLKKLAVSTIFVLVLFITNCGGQNVPPIDGDPTPTPPSTISASDVFDPSMIGQTWTFQNAYGDLTFIAIEPAQFCEFGVCDGKSVVWHFTKNAARAYWNPGVADAELFFVLHHDNDGAWRCVGFKWTADGVQRSAAISLLNGWIGAPYTIIPASAGSPAVNTAYLSQYNLGLEDSVSAPFNGSWVSTWTTYAFAEQTYTPYTGMVNALISKQCEGGHSGACDGVVELWHFCPGVGLCAIEPISNFDANGNRVMLDPNLTLVRVNPPNSASLILNRYFNASMVGQTWNFQNADATCHTTFALRSTPTSNYYPNGSITMNITKPGGSSGSSCYWLATVPDAAIDFVLSPRADGSFNSPGWVVYTPTSVPSWLPCHASPCTEQVQPPSGSPIPYMIVPPDNLIAGQKITTETSYERWDQTGEIFDSITSLNPTATVYWKTEFSLTADGLALSEQWEGDCGHERWYFQAGVGLVRIESLNDGHGTGAVCAGQSVATIFRN